jgi:peptidyl-dipeptidase Dcp
MKINLFMFLILSAFVLQSCGDAGQKSLVDNPLLKEFDTPFGVPPFSEIKMEHYLPAYEQAMQRHLEEVEAIVNQAEAPNFENTIAALDAAGADLGRISSVFYNLNNAHTSSEMQEVAKKLSPMMSEHYDKINLNPALFQRVKEVWDNRTEKPLASDQATLLEKTYKGFVRSGANLEGQAKERLMELNKEISALTLQFGQNVLSETNDFQLLIDKEEDLAGLPQGLRDAAAEAAAEKGEAGKWLFTLQNPSVMPFLQYADNRDLRRKMFEAYSMRGNQGNANDNKEIAIKLANLRREKANLLGYPTHSHYVLEESMAKNPDNVYALLNEVWEKAQGKTLADRAALQAMMAAEVENGVLEPWDWRYYAEKLKAEKYAFNEEELKPYFELSNVTQGMFYVLKELFGMTFKELPELPVYHEDVIAYEVFDAQNAHLGILYMDFHPRASKRGGAWMTSFRSQKRKDGQRVAPVISIVCNFTKPTANEPALLTFDEVETYFHEMGHAIHGLLSDVNYSSLAGTSVPRDFVELPSQILENWAGEEEVLSVYAKHYKTGEVLPAALLKKMEDAANVNQGFATTEYVAASFLDLDYHTITEDITEDCESFELRSVTNMGLMKEIIPRYRSTYFNHIFAGGYSSGYYSYMWSEVLDADAFQAFKETSLFDQATARSFMENILMAGGTGDPAEMYRAFRGKDPSPEALLKRRGLK